jgi:hypothetical protein
MVLSKVFVKSVTSVRSAVFLFVAQRKVCAKVIAEGDGLDVRYSRNNCGFSRRGTFSFLERISSGAKAHRVATVMYELKLVPFIPPTRIENH